MGNLLFLNQLSHISIESGGSSTGDNSNVEISLAAIDLLFAMLKTVSTPSTTAATPLQVTQSVGRADNSKDEKRRTTELKANDDLVAERETARDELWQATWQALRDAVSVRYLSAELALHMCQSLFSLYASNSDAEFRYSANIQILLEMVVVLSRPRLQKEVSSQLSIANNRSTVVEMQLQRAVMDLLKSIKTVDSLAFLSLVSCLCELCFSFKNVLLSIQGINHEALDCGSQPIPLGPCAEKLRMAAGKYLTDILQSSLDDRTGSRKIQVPPQGEGESVIIPVISKGTALSTLDVVVKRFQYDICESAMNARAGRTGGEVAAPIARNCSNLAVGSSASNDGSSSSSGVWFLSSIGRMLSTSSEQMPSSLPVPSSLTPTQISPRRPSVADPMHKFQHSGSSGASLSPSNSRPRLIPGEAPSSSSRFRPLHNLTFEMDLLINALYICFEIADIDNAVPNHRLSISTREMSASLSLWTTVLSVTACCLSPWRESELTSATLTGSGSGSGSTSTLGISSAASNASSIPPITHNLTIEKEIAVQYPVLNLLNVFFPDKEGIVCRNKLNRFSPIIPDLLLFPFWNNEPYLSAKDKIIMLLI